MSVNKTEKNNVTEISVSFLFSIFTRRIFWMILALLVGVAVAFGITRFFITPMYSSTAEFRVDNTSNATASVGSSYLTGTEQLANYFSNEVRGNVFLGKIVEVYNARIADENGVLTDEARSLGLTTLSVERLSSMLTVSAKSESNLFYVKVESANSQEAYKILRVFEEKTTDYLKKDAKEGIVKVEVNNLGAPALSPDSPNLVMNMALGGLISMIAVYAVFFMLAILDNTIYDEDTLKENFDIPVVGTLPQWMKKGDSVQKKRFWTQFKKHFEERGRSDSMERDYEGRLLSPETPFFIAESLKSLRTNLTYISADRESGYAFGVTSAFAGAGKSLLIANVAISFAQLEKKVLLIDADLRCPVQHKIFNTPKGNKGLSGILAGIDGQTLDSCLISGNYGNVDLLPCGHIPPNPSELLSSERMKNLLQQAKEKYDYVFIDLPPVLETTDAGVLAPLVSGYIIVVRSGYSDLRAIRDAVGTMSATKANVVGLILNDINYKRGFGYGTYAYGRYGRDGRYGKYGRYGGRYGRYGDQTNEQ